MGETRGRLHFSGEPSTLAAEDDHFLHIPTDVVTTCLTQLPLACLPYSRVYTSYRTRQDLLRILVIVCAEGLVHGDYDSTPNHSAELSDQTPRRHKQDNPMREKYK